MNALERVEDMEYDPPLVTFRDGFPLDADAALSLGRFRKIYKFFVHTIFCTPRLVALRSGRGAQQLSGAQRGGC